MNELTPILLRGEAHIWTALLPSNLPPTTTDALSADELDRARRFRFAEHYRRYVFAHAVLRGVLSRYLDCSPGDIRFAANPFGKPFVDAPSGTRRPDFNLSHAGGVTLVAVCAGGPVGVDVEEVQPIDDLLSIAESQYAPRERAFILAQPSSQMERAFLRCWTRKEAYVKALGKGLSIQLNSFDTLAEPESGPLRIADLDAPEGYVASVAVERGVDRLVCFEWR